MGVPGFFSWLIKRYPLCLQKLRLGQIPRLDCLYLDMNGILYKCGRDQGTIFKDLLKGKNMEEIFAEIFNFISELVAWVNPQKKIFLGFDGPAPRAKQNQQRSRRFKSAKGYAELNEALQNCGFLNRNETFQNNSISPGTEFMHELNKQMEYFIARQFQEDERWQNLDIIFSGSNVPGEGEHQLLSYIREWTSTPDYDPLTTHCVYGCDADLIMLGLATHVQYMSIIRENFERKQSISHAAQREKDPLSFDMIYLNIVREYMELEFRELQEHMRVLPFELNRIIDDFILICFFIGNDFLPRCYCFDIREGNLEEILDSYKEHLKTAPKFINNDGIIDFEALQLLMKRFSEFESQFISDRSKESQNQVQANNRGKQKRNSELDEDDDMVDDHQEDSQEDAQEKEKNKQTFSNEANSKPKNILSRTDNNSNNNNNNKKATDEKEKLNQESVEAIKQANNQKFKDEADFLKELSDLYQKDEVEARRLFYSKKMKLDLLQEDDIKELHFVIQKYIEGLQFVLLYYFRGCPSWTWYFPYYYAPMTSDILKYLEHFNAETKNTYQVDFEHSQPYPPLQQLMCILHTENQSLLPKPFSEKVLDPTSPFRTPVDYFPTEFEIDPYGALMDYEYIAIIPIPPEEIVSQVYDSIDLSKLTPEESARNIIGDTVLYRYNEKYKKVLFESTIPHIDPTPVQVPVLKEVLKIQENSRFMPKNPKEDADSVSLFPTLYSLQIESGELQNPQKPGCKNRIYLNIESQNTLADLQITRKEFQFVYTEYPNGVKARVIGYINKDQFRPAQGNLNFPVLDEYNYSKKNHKEVFDQLRESVHKDYLAKGVLYQKKEDQTLVFLHIYPEPRRNVNGEIRENPNINDSLYVPLNLLSFEQRVRYPQISDLANQTIQEEFQTGSPCVILRYPEKLQDSAGVLLGQVTGVKPDAQSVTVSPLYPFLQIKDVNKRIEEADAPVFFSVDFVAQKLQISIEGVLTILDNLTVHIDSELPSSKKLTEAIDIGLSIINRQRDSIVPSLVRVHKARSHLEAREKYQQFKHLEISEQIVHLLSIYAKEHPNVIACVERVCALRDSKAKKNISVRDMFPTSKDANLELVKVYIWIMKQETSNLMLSPINSSSITPNSIRALQGIVDNLKKLQLSSALENKLNTKEDVEINANFVSVPSNSSFYLFPCYSKQPQFPEIGDRVVNLNNLQVQRVPFGMCGTIVARSEHQFEVLFDYPFIGGTNLGGQCTTLRGGVLFFSDFYLVDGSSQPLLEPRNSQTSKWGWDGQIVGGDFVPVFQDIPIQKTEKLINTQVDDPFKISEEELDEKHQEFGVPDEPPIPKNLEEEKKEEGKKRFEKPAHDNDDKHHGKHDGKHQDNHGHQDQDNNNNNKNNNNNNNNKQEKQKDNQVQTQSEPKTNNAGNAPQIIQKNFDKPSIQKEIFVAKKPQEKKSESSNKPQDKDKNIIQKATPSNDNFIYVPQIVSSSNTQIESPNTTSTKKENKQTEQPKQKLKVTQEEFKIEEAEQFIKKTLEKPAPLPEKEFIQAQSLTAEPLSVEEIEQNLLKNEVQPIDISELEKEIVNSTATPPPAN